MASIVRSNIAMYRCEFESEHFEEVEKNTITIYVNQQATMRQITISRALSITTSTTRNIATAALAHEYIGQIRSLYTSEILTMISVYVSQLFQESNKNKNSTSMPKRELEQHCPHTILVQLSISVDSSGPFSLLCMLKFSINSLQES